MIEKLMQIVLLQTLALSIATCVVRALQASALLRLGSAARYLSWLLVPVALVALALPHPAGDALVVHVDVGAIAPAWTALPKTSTGEGSPPWVAAAMAAWGVGAVVLAAVLWRRQRVFEAMLAPRGDGRAPSLPAGAGPAVLGIWRPRIVLPLDFDTAFDAEERRLMLLHEGVHLRRYDNAWNLLATALLVLHWFNPVAWWAWRGLRSDQETSCDAAVLREESRAALATYAAALLKVQGVALAPPLATSWQSTHPLVERVRMLQRHRISSLRHRTGLRLAALAVVAAGFGGYALRAGAGTAAATVLAGKTQVLMSVKVEFDKKEISNKRGMNLLLLAGKKMTLKFLGEAAKGIPDAEVGFTTAALSDGSVQIDADWSAGGVASGSSHLVTREGEPARIEARSSDGAHVFAVTLWPRSIAAGVGTDKVGGSASL